MKTFLNLKQYLILFAAVFTMSSCLDSDDPDFQVAGVGYVVQVNSGTTSSFFPMVQIYANEGMTGGCEVTNGNIKVDLEDMGNTNKMYLQTNVGIQSMLANSDLTKVTGQYTIKALNGSGESATGWLSLSASKSMGILKGGVEIDGQTINAYFNLVDDADYYYVFLEKEEYQPYSVSEKNSWSVTELKKATIVTEEGEYKDCYKLSVSLSNIIGSNELTAGRYRIVTAAAIGSSYKQFSILQESLSYKYYTQD